MKSSIGVFIILLLLLFIDTNVFADNLLNIAYFERIDTNQLEFLSRQNFKSCPNDFANIFSKPQVKISIFYGYTDAGHDLVIDGVLTQALKTVLTKPCLKNTGACGFEFINSNDYSYSLRKTIGDDSNPTEIALSVYHSAFSNKNSSNLNPEEYYKEQVEQSQLVLSEFHQAVQNSNVVFYSGHSRLGAGPGFDAEWGPTILWKSWLKYPLKNMLSSLKNQEQTPLKIFGMFSCESEKHYRSALIKTNPSLSLILSDSEVDMLETEQMMIGALDSILMQRCHDDFNESLVPNMKNEHRGMRLIRQ